MQQKKTIIFDFDGTIADSLPVIVKIINTLALQFGYKTVDVDDLPKLQNKSQKELLKMFEISVLKLPKFLLQGKKMLYEQIEEVQVFPHLNEILEKMEKKNYTLGILTSNSIENVEKFLQKHNLDMFDFVHSEKNLFGKHKALKSLLNKYQLNREESVYVGDESRDIEACQKIDLDIISVSWGFNSKDMLEKYNPTHLVDTPAELLQVIENSKN